MNLFEDDDPAGDPALLEGEGETGDGDEEMSKEFLVELQKFATHAQGLASA